MSVPITQGNSTNKPRKKYKSAFLDNLFLILDVYLFSYLQMEKQLYQV